MNSDGNSPAQGKNLVILEALDQLEMVFPIRAF